MGRILLAILAIIAVFILIGPLVGFFFTLLKWGLIIGAVAFGILLVSKWARTQLPSRQLPIATASSRDSFLSQ
ncbi:hypothetical protein [Nonomuraea aurantiaca]|uniref:hypothetical protein n=1 Tax=Nonomuraea aurantiaca TaxID=2878562 RepID=UPI001CD96873|nr:hypothetical protein [Nonomuraea aurantiaca]MCA2221759.1 hypothetical protein [Nonomuraea aurantiaca]